MTLPTNWATEFHMRRHDSHFHLGLGDVRVTMADQDDICEQMSALAAELAEYKEGIREVMTDHAATLDKFAALVEAARDVVCRGPKCDCEICEDAFDRLRDMLPYEYTSPDSASVSPEAKPCATTKKSG